jgi:hypothetical protein
VFSDFSILLDSGSEFLVSDNLYKITKKWKWKWKWKFSLAQLLLQQLKYVCLITFYNHTMHLMLFSEFCESPPMHWTSSTIYNLYCSLSFCSSEHDRVWSSHDIHQTSLRYRTHRPLPDSSELTIFRILNAALTSVCMATLFILLPCVSISNATTDRKITWDSCCYWISYLPQYI